MNNSLSFTKSIFSLCLIFCFDLSAQSQEVLWKFKTGDRVYSSAAINSNKVFIGSGDHNLYALDKKTGTTLWKLKTAGAVHSSPLLYSSMVYAGSSDGNLYAVNEADGKITWQFSSKGEKMYDLWDYYLSSPVASDGVVYWGSGDGHVYALEASTGKLIWKFATGDVVHATPAIDSNYLYIGSFDGHFYCLNKSNGQLIWKFKTVGDKHFPKGEIQNGATVKNGVVYFGSRDYNIYAVDAKKGTGHWNMKEKGSWVIATPLLFSNNVYFGTSDTHAFYALGAEYGEDRWKLKLNMRVYGTAVAHDSTIYFGCFNGKLYGVDPSNGKIKMQFQTEGSRKNYAIVYAANDEFRKDFSTYGEQYLEAEKKLHALGSVLSTPAISDGVLYFGSSDGYVYAVKLN
jgi:outer membrane protein assembly factor BamB